MKSLLSKIYYLIFIVLYTVAAPGFSTGKQQVTFQEFDITMTSGRFERHFRIHIPEIPVDSYPVVVAFHGAFDTGPDFQTYARLEDYGDRLGMITVYPDGYGGSWANGNGSIVDKAGVDDVKFFNEIIEFLQNSYKINMDRIYAVGHSNGGMFCHRLARENHKKLTAFVTVDATIPQNIYNNYRIPTEIPVLMINGDKDRKVPFKSTHQHGRIGVWDALKLMLKNNVCDPDTRKTHYLPDIEKDNKRVRRETYYNKSNEPKVELIVVEGGGHEWYIGDAYNNEVIIDFLYRYSK